MARRGPAKKGSERARRGITGTTRHHVPALILPFPSTHDSIDQRKHVGSLFFCPWTTLKGGFNLLHVAWWTNDRCSCRRSTATLPRNDLGPKFVRTLTKKAHNTLHDVYSVKTNMWQMTWWQVRHGVVSRARTILGGMPDVR